jgi:hypothetical protein
LPIDWRFGWHAIFPFTNRDPLTDPDFDGIAHYAKEMIKKRTAAICWIPISQPTNRLRQSDRIKCGCFAALNVYAVFQAERQHYVRLDEIASDGGWFIHVLLRPFWNLPKKNLADPNNPSS